MAMPVPNVNSFMINSVLPMTVVRLYCVTESNLAGTTVSVTAMTAEDP